MASITVDIQAKVVGYEASLKAMKDAFSKIDPGSDIGKSLEKAIKYAEGQLKNLNKNLTPKASSDTQIDSIVEKTNRAGEAIQEVTRLMQKVNIGDIDFSSFENGIGKLMGTLRDLETELDSRVSKGLRETIANSSELTESFSKLNIDTKDKSAGEIFEIVAEKAKKAAEETETAQSKLDAAQKNLNSQQGKLNQLESNPIYDKSALEQDLQNIAVEYTKTFDEIKIKIQEGLNGLLGNDSVKANKLMENFMSGLNPQTLKDHLMQLKNELQQELTQNNSAKDIYRALLGDEGAGGNAQAITTKLLSSLNQSLPQVKEALQNKIQEFISSLTNKEAGQITTLINLGDIENAVKTTIQAVERAYDSVKGAAAKQRAEVLRAMEGKETAQTGFNTAQQNQQDIESLRASLQDQINKLLDENGTLKADIAKLRSEIDAKKNAETTKIRQAAAESNTKTNNLKIAAEEAKMYRTELQQVQAKEKLVGKVEGVVQRWFSIYAAVRMVGNAIRSVISTVKELDKTITEIAIVTDMTQNELWGQMKSYTDMARQYAASISGVYQVSQLYYQQGLKTAEVMALTEETLKMARISGLDYAEATDYMTNAIRSFKMEMTDAQVVVDVYSAIAASSATSTSELANAMSKTASSAAAVGSSFENTTAMMAVMIEATRESAENIGSAMKSIISRYGEMKADPSKLVDSEGQEMSLNKVDKALQSVGISIQDINHQFRNFDDVITELAGKWDTIDTNTQRYIATVMAGNRQQSRFLALVSNGERLAELSETAANSEDAATLQVLKTMDSIEAKSQQLKTSLQSLYTSTGIQNLFKGFLDIGNQIVKTFTQMPTVFGAPIPAILKIGTTFASLANVVTTVFGLIKAKTQAQIAALNGQEQAAAQERVNITNIEYTEKNLIAEQTNAYIEARMHGLTETEAMEARERVKIAQQEAEQKRQAELGAINSKTGITKKTAGTALGLNIAGVALSTISGAISDKTQWSKIAKGFTGIAGSAASMAGLGTMMSPGNPLVGAGIGAALGTVMGIVENINFLFESAEARATRLKEAATEAKNKSLQENAEAKDLNDQISKLKELEKTQYDSVEARKEYLEACNQIAAQHPELVSSYTSEGDAIIDLTKSYEVLAEARQKAYEAAQEAAGKSAQEAEDAYKTAQENREEAQIKFLEARSKENYNFGQKDRKGNQIETYQEAAKLYSNYDNLIGIGLSDDAASMINALLYDIQTNAYGGLQFLLNDRAELVNDALKELEESGSDLGLTIFDLISNYTSGIEDVDRNIESKKNERDIVNQSELLKVVDRNNQLKKAEALKEGQTEVLQELPDAGVLIGNYLSAEFKAYQENWENIPHTKDNALEQFQEDEYEKLYDSVYTALNEFWETKLITASSKERFTKILGNRGKYTQDQLIKELGIEGNEELEKSIAQYYKDAFNFDKFAKALAIRKNKQEENGQDVLKLISANGEVTKNLGSEELQTLLSVYDQVANLIENHKISPEIGQKIMNSYMSLWEATQNLELFDDESREAAQELISGWDDFSLAGLNNFRKAIASSGLNEEQQKILIESAESFSDLIPKNFTTEVASFAQKVTSNIEDFEKAISNAAKGMDLKTATEIAQKLGKSLSDFDFKDGKFFFDDFAAIRDAYLGENQQYIDDLQDEATKQKEVFTKAQGNEANLFKALDVGRASSDELREVLERNVKSGFFREDLSIDQIVEAYSNFLQRADTEKNNFVEWVAENYDKQLAEAVEKTEQYTNDQIARTALSTGNFSDFLKTVGIKSDWGINYYNNLLKNGELDTIINRFPEYASDILKYYQDINKNVYDKLISGLDSQQYINADEFNAETLQSLETAGLVEKISGEGSKAIYKTLDKMTDEQLNLFAQTIANSNMIEADKQKMLASIHTEQYEHNVVDAFSSIVGSFDSFSYEAGQKLALALGKDLSDVNTMFSTDAAGNLVASYDNLIEWLNTSGLDKTSKQYNDLRAKLEAHQRELSTDKILTDIIQNRDKLDEENIASLAQILKVSYDTVIRMVHQNADGTYTINLATLVAQLDYKQVELSDAVIDLIANQMDAIISSVTGLAGSQSKGFTNLGSMQKYVTSLREKGVTINGEEASLDNLFEYNESLRAYQLSSAGIIANIQGNKKEIDRLRNQLNHTSDTDARVKLQEQIDVAETFIDNSIKEFADAIDLSSFLDADFGSAAAVQAEVKIKKAVEDYNSALLAMGETAGINADKLINALKAGGEVAVKAMEQVAEKQGKTLSASDVESAYRGEIDKYINAIDTIIAKPGEIIDTITADLIINNGGQVNEIGNTGQYVVETAANLYEAYNDLLHRMAATGEATLADLNKVAALALENRDGEQQVIDALGDAAGMTFTRFGEILANAGVQLTEDMVNNLEAAGIIDLMGGNKMKIIDFQAFADLMHWDADSEEYISAFKTYNDSLIEMNRQAERNILEEAESVAGAKGGDWVNLTQLMNKLQESFRYVGSEKISLGDSLAASIQKFGAKIEDGILKLDDSTNIPAIMQEIAQAAAESGGLLSNELAELADAVADAIKGYADLISGAISGSLSNTQAEQLQDWASTNGIGKLNFIKTADGLKVATDQAFELVGALQQVDSIQSKLTFNNLVDSLSADKGGKFENISKTTAEIAKLNKEYEKNKTTIENLQEAQKHADASGRDNIGKEIARLEDKNSKLREQIGLYREIQQRQSIDPSQYNFMDRDLPNAMQGPINYWNSVGKAFSAMNESSKTGMMEIQDFYNIVNEMENLANISGTVFDFAGYAIGGEASQAADLIQNGMSALTNIDGKGVKINLQNLGIDFADGANGAKNDFHKGVQALAKSQVEMLDAAIRVLEVVVAMEKLGNIDVNGDNKLNLGEIFNITTDETGDFTKGFHDWAETIKEQVESGDYEDLKAGLESISVNGNTLKDMIYAATGSVEEQTAAFEKLNLTEQQYVDVINAFYQAALNGDYNLDTIQDSVWEILDKTLPEGSIIDLGERSIVISGGTHTVIDWNKEGTKEGEKLLKDTLDEEITTTKDALFKAFEKYQQGEASNLQVTAVLSAKGLIKINTEKGTVEIDGKDVDLNTAEAQQHIAEIALADYGVENITSTPLENDGTYSATAKGTINIGNTTIDVTYDDGNVLFHSNRTNADYGSITELQQAEITWLQETMLAEEGRTPTRIEAGRLLYGIEYEPNVEITTNINEPDVRQKALEVSKTSTDEIVKLVKENGVDDGFFEMETDKPGYVKFNLGGIEVEVEDTGSLERNIAAAQQKIEEIVDPDGTVDTIAQAITTAFTTNGNEIGDAIGKGILNAMHTFDGSQMNETPEIPSIDAKVGEVHITEVGSASMGGSGLTNKIASFFGGTKAVTIDSMDGQLTNLSITGVTNPVDFSKVTADAKSESLTIDNLTATATTLDVANVGETVLGAEASVEVPVTADTADAEEKIDQVTKKAVEKVSKDVDVNAELSQVYKSAISEAQKGISKKVTLEAVYNNTWKTIIADAKKPIEKLVKLKAVGATNLTSAKGNVALVKGNAKAAGTLMGELGPELVVSQGRYFLVGQAGPEMVSLKPDAIIFNHLQTQQLLSKGHTPTHGKPVTNERKATSFATGNTNGPAMASASAALAQLKQLREMWRSLANASLQNMGGMGGGSGGGGGGGGDTDKVVEGITANVERWYNWLQLIDKTQDHLNTLTKQYDLLTEKGIKNNTDAAKAAENLTKQYKDQVVQLKTNNALVVEQSKERARMAANMNSGLFSAFYQMDPTTGQITLKNDEGFSDYIRRNGNNGALSTIMNTQGGVVFAGQSIHSGYSAEQARVMREQAAAQDAAAEAARQTYEANREAEKAAIDQKYTDLKANSKKKIRKSAYDALSDEQKQLYVLSKKKYVLKSDEEIQALADAEKWQVDARYNNLIQSTQNAANIVEQQIANGIDIAMSRNIHTGLDLMQELQATNSAGNLIHNAHEQLEILKAFGLYTADLQAGVDMESEDWEASVVQNFYDKVENDKSEAEALNESIQEHTEAALEAEKAMAEINNQFEEMAAPVEGITESIEKWYTWSRKIITAQHELNLLTTKYSQLQNSIGDRHVAMVNNLTEQMGNVNTQLASTIEQRQEKQAKLAEDLAKLGEQTKRIYTIDESGNAIYSTAALEATRARTFDITQKSIKTDAAGNYLTDEDGLYQYVEEIISSSAFDMTSPQKFIEQLIATNGYGKSVFTDQQQREILEQAGFASAIAEFAKINWNEANLEDKNKAAAEYLKYISEVPAQLNEVRDSINEDIEKEEQFKNQILQINKQIKEVADVAAGIQSPFEKWYTWTQKITQEQNKLNLLTKQYNNLQKANIVNGNNQAANLLEQLEILQKQQQTNKDYTQAREGELNNLLTNLTQSATLSKLFTYNSQDGLQYSNNAFDQKTLNTNGIRITGIGADQLYTYASTNDFTFSAKNAEDLINKLTEQYADNSMRYNTSEQFEILKAFGFSDLMKYDTSGNETFVNGIENATKEEMEKAVDTVLKNSKDFMDKVNTEITEIQSLNEKTEDIQSSIFDLQQQLLNNEITLENQIMQAIEDREQKTIDDLKKQKEIISDAAKNLLDGLNEQLNKEKSMYEQQEKQDDLNKLQRQLAILQRSGGSSSQIRSLQEQIRSQQKDMYFDERQRQIDAIKEASDKQIEKLDRQIEIAEETLAYNKENGLFWIEVREIMEKSFNDIVAFIVNNSKELQSLSALQQEQQVIEFSNTAGVFKGTVNKYKDGGLIDYTGPAWVDGSKGRPEGILNSDQTDFLRNELVNSLELFANSIEKFRTSFLIPNSSSIINSITNDNEGINIENLDFIMNVENIANDYDARRAGQQAFEEMVRIARKSGNRTISRR